MGYVNLKLKRGSAQVMLSPLIYANNFIKRSLETKVPLTHMKLQKLLYLLYARYYALHSAPLFADQFEKWPYGPVLSEVYTAFKDYRANVIDRMHRNEDGDVLIVSEEHELFIDCFNEVWAAYGGWDGIQLSVHTHKGAWSKVEADEIFLKKEDIIEDGKNFFAA